MYSFPARGADLGAWYNNIGDLWSDIKAPVEAGVTLFVPGGGALVAAANTIIPAYNAATKQIVNTANGQQITNAQVAAGLVNATQLAAAQQQAQLAGASSALGSTTIPTQYLYIGGAAVLAALLLARRRNPRGRRVRRSRTAVRRRRRGARRR